ncbi:hypothetical protein BGZ73_003401 [Actinomortierella ambigua]|nr:hypothetical protein BGZ73_003401 [Actinomortierella ambigua]
MANEACILDATSLEVVRVWGGHTDWIFGNSLQPRVEGRYRNQLLSVTTNGKLVIWRFDESRVSVVKSKSVQLNPIPGDPIMKLIVSPLDSNAILYLSALDEYQTAKASISAPDGEAFISADFVDEKTLVFQTNKTSPASKNYQVLIAFQSFKNSASGLHARTASTPTTSTSKAESRDVIVHHANESLPFSGITCSMMLDDTRVALGRGGSDGSVRIWNTETNAELACFRNHSSSVKFFVQMPDDVNSRLRKCMVSIAEDYSISVISFEEMSCIYLFGAYQHRLLSIQWRPPEDYVVLCYSDGVALVWQEKRRENLWKTPGGLKGGHLQLLFKLDELWFIMPRTAGIQSFIVNWRLLLATVGNIRVPEPAPPSVTSARGPRSHGPPKRLDTLISGIKHHQRSVSELPPSRTPLGEDGTGSVSPALPEKAQNNLNAAKALLGLLVVGDDPHSLSIRTLFGLGKCHSNASIGMRGMHANYSMLFNTLGGHKEGWCTSPTLTASRLIAIISLARSIAMALRIDVDLDTWTRGYCDALPDHVGPKFRAPSLSFLAKYWQHPQPEIQEATKIIMLSTLRGMPKSELQNTVEYWADYLPAAASPENCSTQVMARSAIILGILGADNPHALPERTRQFVGISLTLLLEEESKPTYMMAAIELIAQGFATWQPYLRADAVLKTLIGKAADTSPLNKFVCLRARKAVGQIAAINPTLFVRILTQEISDAKMIDEKIGYMKLVSYFARKEPKVLYFGVQRLADVIVKALDPSAASVREALLPVGTQVLMDLVQGYPQIDFHGGSQKLAVGSLEGAIIVYDLLTATRWQVLEGHKTPLSAVTFSKDGRTIVSCAVQEGTVKIWHPNVGFLGMLLGGGHGLWSATTATTTTTSAAAAAANVDLGTGSGSGSASSDQAGTTSGGHHAAPRHGAGPHDTTGGAAKPTSASSALSSQKSNKTFDFALHDDCGHSGLDDPAVLLSQVRFDWPSDRVVKLTVLDHIMTFNI